MPVCQNNISDAYFMHSFPKYGMCRAQNSKWKPPDSWDNTILLNIFKSQMDPVTVIKLIELMKLRTATFYYSLF